MTPRKASKPAARTVKRTTWLILNTAYGIPESAYKFGERGYALSDWKEYLECGSHIMVRATYELPLRTKR